MLRFRFMVLGLILSCLAIDTASAGLFRFGQRRWERRKAELRAELVWQLENKLDTDLTREVAAVTAKLTESAKRQVQTEAGKLDLQLKKALAELHKEASNAVAAEAQRLDKQIDDQMTQLRKQSEALVAAEAARLKEQTDKEIAALRTKYAEQSQALQKSYDQQVAKLPSLISTEIEKAVAARKGKREAAESAEPVRPTKSPGDDDSKKVGQVPAAALTTREVVLSGADSDSGGPNPE